MAEESAARLYRFGVFEADNQARELRKQGRRLGLQDQPLEVLLLLLERQGQIVTRAELQRRVWPDGTFVDFEHGINSAINKIRDALGDSASNPRFIETVAKRGYRFIAGVETSTIVTAAIPEPQSVADGRERSVVPVGIKRQFLTSAEEVPKVPQVVALSLFVLLQLMYLSFYVVTLARLKDVEEAIGHIVAGHFGLIVPVIASAAAGIPTRLYLLSGVAFRSPALRSNFLKLFPLIFPFDALWGLAPFLLLKQIGFGLALAATAALLYAPFAQRALILMTSAD